MYGQHVRVRMLVTVFLSLLLSITYQVCLPQYDYMVNLYEQSQETSTKTKVHSFASNGLYWTDNTMDFTFHVGSKESDLTVHKAELILLSRSRLEQLLLLESGHRVKVIIWLYILRRDTNLLIFNETHHLGGGNAENAGDTDTAEGGVADTTVEDISVNLTPFLRRASLDLPRFRVGVNVYKARKRLPYTAQDILQDEVGCTAPFIIITTGKKQELAYVTNIIERKKRGATGFTPDTPNTIQYTDVTPLETPNFQCQKVKFDLNLADIGWDSWMIVPKTVDIGVCQGTCDNVNGLIPHALAKHKINQVMPNQQIGAICCQEASYREIDALYQIDGSLVKSILPKFVVHTCRCR